MCSMNEPYFKALLEGCRAAGVVPDFISWHYYGNSLEAILGSVARARKLCDDMGFGACDLLAVPLAAASKQGLLQSVTRI